MNKKLFSTKNNFHLVNSNEKENPCSNQNLMIDQRSTNFKNLKQHQSTILKKQSASSSKQSNFEQLKQQIKCLQNSQFLSLKYRCSTEPDQKEQIKFRVTGKQFMPSKKVTQLEKFKLYLRRRGKTRKISLLLDKKKFQQGKDYNCLSYLQVKDINACIKEQNLKKKQTPSIVKKYYRPLSSKNMSTDDIKEKQNHVRGRSLKSSSSSRPEKENILIYCF